MRAIPAGRLGALRAAAAGLLLATVACASSAPRPPDPLPRPTPPEIPSGALDAASGSGQPAAPAMLRTADLALTAARFERADSVLLELWRGCGDTPAGHRALLLLAGTRLDPRNESSDPGAAAWAAARYLSLPGADDWARPLAGQLYLVALEMGADTVPAAALERASIAPGSAAPGDPGPPRFSSLSDCDAAASSGSGAGPVLPLPRLSSRPVTRELAALQARVAVLERELDRIRKTLHP